MYNIKILKHQNVRLQTAYRLQCSRCAPYYELIILHDSNFSPFVFQPSYCNKNYIINLLTPEILTSNSLSLSGKFYTKYFKNNEKYSSRWCLKNIELLNTPALSPLVFRDYKQDFSKICDILFLVSKKFSANCSFHKQLYQNIKHHTFFVNKIVI